MKRTLALLMAVLMLTALLPLSAAAANGEKLIAITYDDGPSQYTAELLDGLKARGAKATFFVVGYQAQARPSIVQREWMEGHQVANHTWDHPQLTKQSAAGVQSQLSRTDAMLDRAIGFDQNYMLRPPYGDYNQAVLNAAGVPAVFWSMDTADYKTSDASVVCSQIVRAARDGGICCIHDTHLSTVRGSLQAIDILKQQGYQFVTVEELLYRRGITPKNGVIYSNAYPGSTADKLAKPVISQADTAAGKQITISGDSRTAIYYTLDGSQPTPVNSTRYTGAFTVSNSCTVRAVGVVKWNGLRTDAASLKVEYIPAAAPTITLGEGGVIRMSSVTPGAVIHYTTDNTAVSASSPVYDNANPPAAVKGTTYRAIAVAQGLHPSAETYMTYGASGSVMRDVVVSDWYYAAIDRAVGEGILKGVSPDYMAPNEKLTRAMLVTILYRATRPEGTFPAARFADTDSGEYYAEPLNWAVANGIVKGYPDWTFRPHQNITREELCTMMERYLATRGISGDGANVIAGFADAARVSDWARQSVNTVVQKGVVKGYDDNTIRPQGNATRAEAVTMVLRAMDLPDPAPVVPETPEQPAPETPEADVPAAETPQG